MKKTIEEMRNMSNEEIRNRCKELFIIVGENPDDKDASEEWRILDAILDDRYEEEAERNGYYDWDDNLN